MYAQWNTSSDFDQSVDSARVAADNNDNGHEDERRDTEPTDHPADRPNALNGLIGAVTKLVDGVRTFARSAQRRHAVRIRERQPALK